MQQDTAIQQEGFLLKSNRYGLTLILDPDIPFDILLSRIGEKFRQSERFFRNAQMALSIRGRQLTQQQESAVVSAITDNCRMHIVCLMEDDPNAEEEARQALIRVLSAGAANEAEIVRGSLRSGQRAESGKSLLILGDLNPGAEAVSAGDVIIMGCCMGTVRAGVGGNREALVAAVVLKPKELHIADKGAVSAITKRSDSGEYAPDPQLAYIADDHLRIEKLGKDAFDRLVRSSEPAAPDGK